MTSTPNERPVAPAPFTSDAEYIEFTLSGFVAARVNRLSAEKALQNTTRYPTPRADRILCRKKPGPETEAQQKVTEALLLEAHAVVEYAQRLEAHRHSPGVIKLGLDQTADAFALTRDEELILLALVAPAISPSFAEGILSGLELRYFGGGLTVDDLVSLLDPESLADRVKFRAYFHRASRLIQSNLISISFHSGLNKPSDFLEGQASLSPLGFAYLLGLSPAFMAGESEIPADLRGTQA